MEKPSSQEREIQQRIAANAVNQFSRQLYQSLATDAGNLFFSPWSIHAAMTMAWNGAAGRTAAQMADVLHWPAELPGSKSTSGSPDTPQTGSAI